MYDLKYYLLLTSTIRDMNTLIIDKYKYKINMNEEA